MNHTTIVQQKTLRVCVLEHIKGEKKPRTDILINPPK